MCSSSPYQFDLQQVLVIDRDLLHRLILLANIPDHDQKVQPCSQTGEVYLLLTIGILEVFRAIDKVHQGFLLGQQQLLLHPLQKNVNFPKFQELCLLL